MESDTDKTSKTAFNIQSEELHKDIDNEVSTNTSNIDDDTALKKHTSDMKTSCETVPLTKYDNMTLNVKKEILDLNKTTTDKSTAMKSAQLTNPPSKAHIDLTNEIATNMSNIDNETAEKSTHLILQLIAKLFL